MKLLGIVLLALVLISAFFATINSIVANKEKKKFAHFLISGISTVITDVAIGLIIISVPALIMVNYLKPQPESIMPAIYYDGTYSEITDIMTTELAESLVNECTERIRLEGTLTAYYDRAYLYFFTNNYDLAQEDLLHCFEDSEEWKYLYDMGVVCGYMLDYESSIRYFEDALALDIPLSDRGIVQNSLSLIRSYFDGWLFSLFG